MKFILIFALCYFLGSIPFGLLVGRWWARVDVREYGSGNIGMTNVLRTTGWFCALLTLIGDMGKGTLSVYLARNAGFDPTICLIAGIFAVVGHNWPIFLRFKGGKGVATIAGVLIAYQPIVAAILLAIWLAVLLIWRYISLASIVVAVCLPFVLVMVQSRAIEVALATVVAALTVFKHRSNIERLRQGTEYRFGQKVS